MKIIRSVQGPDGVVYQKQPDGGSGRVRCMKCQCLMAPLILPSGQQVMKCGGCGAMHTAVSMDKPYTPPVGTVPKRPAT